METPVQPKPKKMNTTLIIIIVVVIVLCCCCVIVGGGGYYYFSTKVKDTYSSINEALMTPSVPDIPVIPLPTNESGTPEIPDMPSIPNNVIPQGGLGDDVLRANTWGYVITAAALSSCVTTEADKVTIDVLEQPDSAGVWKEKWTVACDGGSTKAFEITFTPSAKGGTDISVTSSK
jgi:hypothetical protein